MLFIPLAIFAQEIQQHSSLLEKRAEMPIEQSAIAPRLKGLLLMSDQNDKYLYHTRCFYLGEGLQVEGLKVPGGVAALQKHLQPFFDAPRPLTVSVIDEVRESILQYYQKQSRPLVTVEVPQQEITNGRLQLILFESALGKVTTSGNKWFPDASLVRALDVKAGEPIELKPLLNSVDWLNQNPFRLTDVVLSAGAAHNTTDIELRTQDRFPLRCYAGADNTGTQVTNPYRCFTGIDWAIWIPFDQILSYQFSAAPVWNQFQSHTLHYTAYLPWKHIITLFGGYSFTSPRLSSDFQGSGYNGQGSLRYDIPFPSFYSNLRMDLQLGFDYKIANNNLLFIGEQEQTITGSLVNVTQLVAAFDLAQEIERHKVIANATLFQSLGNLLPHETSTAYNAFTTAAVPFYFYMKFLLNYHYRSPYLGLWVQGRAQKAFEQLLQTEQFALGGYDTVRGYFEREFLADSALLLNVELRAPGLSLFQLSGNRHVKDELIFLAFCDYGMGTNLYPILGQPHRNETLASVGAGARWMVRSNLSARLDYGFRILKHLPEGNTALGRLHFGGMCSF